MQTTTMTPAAALETLARAALTVEHFFCYDESVGQILTHALTRCAERIARLCKLPESEMDTYRRIVFTEGPATHQPLTADELIEARIALNAFTKSISPNDEDLTDALNALDSIRKLYGDSATAN